MNKTLTALQDFGGRIDFVTRVFLGLFTIVQTVLVSAQFVLRWFKTSLSFATELSCLLFIWTTMLGSAVACRYLQHIGVDAIVNLFKGTPRKIVRLSANIILVLALLLFTVSSAIYTMRQIPHMGTSVKVSIAWFYVSLPVSGVVMLYHTLVQTIEIFVLGNEVRRPLPGGENERENTEA